VNKPQEVTAAIEDRFSDAPWMKGLEANPIFSRFMTEIAPRIELKKISTAIIEAFINVDVTADKIGQFLQGNPYYEDMFLRVIAAMGRAETPGISAAVVLLGMQRSRNLILALQLFRSIQLKHPEVSADGKLNFKPDGFLKYALKMEEQSQQSKDRYGDTAFAGALLFDYLDQYAVMKQADPAVLNFISTQFGHGLRTGKVARELSSLLTDFNFPKHVMAAGLVHDIGKVVMALLEPSVMDFYDKCFARDVPRDVRHVMERERFGITHDVIGAICCELFHVFKPISRAVLFHHEPYLLKRRNPKQYQLAALLSLSSNVASSFQLASGTADPVLEKWKGPDLKDFKIEMGKLVNIVNTVIKKG